MVDDVIKARKYETPVDNLLHCIGTWTANPL
jgi:hypothetical protein